MPDPYAHWKQFYSSRSAPTFPSQFAVFVQSWLRNTAVRLVEFGCGNGRDAEFFWAQQHEIIATDQLIVDDLWSWNERERFTVVQGPVQETSASIFGPLGPTELPVVVYSRFFQHSIEEEVEKVMFHNLSQALPPDSTLFFEFRLDQDSDRPKVFGGHFRRFPNAEEFVGRAEEFGLRCVYHCQGQGYAMFGSEDPYIGRFVLTNAEADSASTAVAYAGPSQA